MQQLETQPGAIHASAVGKTFPGADRAALSGVDLSIAPGRVCALLGANGAGKSTLIRILTTLARKDTGVITVGGWDLDRDPEQVRAAIGVVGQYAALDELLTARENVELFARLIGLSRAESRTRATQLLETAGLGEFATQRVAEFSGGMRRRLDLVTSMITRPSILLIDEPTTGLDPIARRAMWEAIRVLVTEGTTVLLTTQYLDEADDLADEVVILRAGRVLATGTPRDLKALVGAPRWELRQPTLEDVYLHFHEGGGTE